MGESVYLSSRLLGKINKFISVYKQDVLIGVTPSEKAVIVYEPLHSTQLHCAATPYIHFSVHLCAHENTAKQPGMSCHYRHLHSQRG